MRYHLGDVIKSLGHAMIELEMLERRFSIADMNGQGEHRERYVAAIIRAHLLAEAAFDTVKNLRDLVMLDPERYNPMTHITSTGRVKDRWGE